MPPQVARMFNAPAFALTQIRLTVVSTVPKGIVHIDENTEVELREEFEEARGSRADVNYDDVGGMGDTIRQLREMVELPLRYPELFTRLGVDPPRGVLLHGPPGTGKTRLARAVANESEANFFTINGPEIMGSAYGESEKRLREVFEEAAKAAPSIVFIDEIDSIAPKRTQVHGEAEKRLVAQLLTLMDGLHAGAGIVVIAATNRPDAIDEALRRPGRFDREIVIGVPDESGRREIIGIHTRGMPLGEGVDLDELARTTHGFVGADIAALAREAAMDAVRRIMPQLDLEAQTIPPQVLEDLSVTRDDFLAALKRVQPSRHARSHGAGAQCRLGRYRRAGRGAGEAQGRRRTAACAIPRPSAGSASARPRASCSMARPAPARPCSPRRWPRRPRPISSRSKARTSCRNGMARASSSSRGCSPVRGKSRLASSSSTRSTAWCPRAAAAGAAASRKSPRGWSTPSSPRWTAWRSCSSIVLIGATNRPALVDPALLRPGRLDELVYVGTPDLKGREHILKIHTAKMPMAKDVDLAKIAHETERFTGADLEDVVRRAGLAAIRTRGEDAKTVKAEDFIAALADSRATVTPEMEEEYMKLKGELKKRAMEVNPIGFVVPGMLQSTRDKKGV